ncbi:MAG TPA: acyltransferase [Blastocatellia bacterium]|nr:acyltransferase [Blastocatellia bacterium]
MKRLVKAILTVLLSIFPTPKHPQCLHDGLHLHWRLGWLRARWCLLYYRLRAWFGGTTLIAGERFSVHGCLRLRGGGQVIFGDDVIIGAATDIFTHDHAATVRVGHRGFLNGARFSAVERIEIGDDAVVADARLMDTDFHSLSKRRQQREAPIGAAPIHIQNNVWIAAGSAVLKGVKIGENSVIAFGSVVVKDIPANVIASGNPCRAISTVPE